MYMTLNTQGTDLSQGSRGAHTWYPRKQHVISTGQRKLGCAIDWGLAELRGPGGLLLRVFPI